MKTAALSEIRSDPAAYLKDGEPVLVTRNGEAAGVYVRRLDEDEQRAVARRLTAPVRGKDEQPFRP